MKLSLAFAAISSFILLYVDCQFVDVYTKGGDKAKYSCPDYPGVEWKPFPESNHPEKRPCIGHVNKKMKWQDAERYCRRIDKELFPPECLPINGTNNCKGFWIVWLMGNHIDAENETWGSTWLKYAAKEYSECSEEICPTSEATIPDRGPWLQGSDVVEKRNHGPWLSGNDIKNEGKWFWGFGDEIKREGQGFINPNFDDNGGPGGNEDCMAIWNTAGAVNDRRCDEELTSLCSATWFVPN